MAIKNLARFDIDGTLHKTEVMSLASFRVVCAEYALPVPDMQTLYQTYGANEQTLMDLLVLCAHRRRGVAADAAGRAVL